MPGWRPPGRPAQPSGYWTIQPRCVPQPRTRPVSSITPDRFVDAALAHGPRLDHSSALRRRDYLERVVVGGFPEAVRRTPRRRAAFFDSYLSTLIERDVLELATIERRGELHKLLALLAARAGGLLVSGTIAG